eukprot:1151572-Pelagomonas_calceolata.AAC.2
MELKSDPHAALRILSSHGEPDRRQGAGRRRTRWVKSPEIIFHTLSNIAIRGASLILCQANAAGRKAGFAVGLKS